MPEQPWCLFGPPAVLSNRPAVEYHLRPVAEHTRGEKGTANVNRKGLSHGRVGRKGGPGPTVADPVVGYALPVFTPSAFSLPAPRATPRSGPPAETTGGP